MTKATPTGAGTRPSTDGTVDNMGAGEAFIPGSSDSSPAPTEAMSGKRQDAQSVEKDDSAPFSLTEDADAVKPEHRREQPSDQDR
ncbi:hypothetical protein [Xylophilus sp. Leaf220]|uniref:hypothetical protein n=1 Tax=Xylophilus sp. Leaf220 TaxID=1735686 RepID=UPI0006FCC44F|nr:hypothetical protein [Xylophilus sp. Leaf220]KQM80374.1 hypothetical protein ASE76_04370 [Xylophilus sp. Leaf220]